MADSMASAPELQKKTRLISSRTAGHQLLGQDPGQEGAVHLHHVRQVEIDGLVQCRLERRMASTEGVDAESGEEVEIPLALGVEEVAALAPDVEAIEPDRLEHPAQLVIQVLLMERVVLPVPLPEQFANIEHRVSPSWFRSDSLTR